MTKTKANNKAWLVLMMLGCLMMNGCGMNSTSSGRPDEPGPAERTAEEVFTEFMDAIDDTVNHSGTTWPIWDRNHTAGFFAQPCSVHERADGRSYQTQIEGGSVADPQAAVDRMKAHWESKGYTIGNIFDDGSPATGIQMNARTPTGVRLQFSPTPAGSLINVISVCTLDPAARKKTT